MKRMVIVCESLTGNTAMLAEALRSHMSAEHIRVLTPAQVDPDQFDVFFVGSWTDKGDCAAATGALLQKLHDKSVFLFGTCGFGGSEAYFESVYHRFADHLSDDNRVIGHFVCQGKMPESVLHRYETMKNSNPNSERWNESIENYYNALHHPNGKDLRMLCEAADAAMNANLSE